MAPRHTWWTCTCRARGVDTREKSQLVDYYMFVWKLFYAEYLLIPLFG